MKTRNALLTAFITFILLGVPASLAASCKTPTNFYGKAYGNSIALYWNNIDSNAKRFTVYYGTTPGSYTASGTTPSPVGYTLSNVEKGKRYYFTLTASGNDCTESFRTESISVVGGQVYNNNTNGNTTNNSTVPTKTTPPKRVPTSGSEIVIPALIAIAISSTYFFVRKRKNVSINK